MSKLVLLVVLVAGCDKEDPNCKPAVDHVFQLTLMGPKPSADEQSAIDHIKRQTLKRCNSEGLSVEQRDCIVAAKSLRERSFLMCPALVAKPPSWIIAPIGHPEVLEQLPEPLPEPTLDQDP